MVILTFASPESVFDTLNLEYNHWYCPNGQNKQNHPYFD